MQVCCSRLANGHSHDSKSSWWKKIIAQLHVFVRRVKQKAGHSTYRSAGNRLYELERRSFTSTGPCRAVLWNSVLWNSVLLACVSSSTEFKISLNIGQCFYMVQQMFDSKVAWTCPCSQKQSGGGITQPRNRTFDEPCTQWCIFLSQEVREISRFFVAPPMRVRPRPPRGISSARFEFLLINLHHWVHVRSNG